MSYRAATPEAHIRRGVIVTVVLGVMLSRPIAGTAQTSVDEVAALKADAEQYFRDRVTPFIKTYCLPCHQNKRPTEGGVNFSLRSRIPVTLPSPNSGRKRPPE